MTKLSKAQEALLGNLRRDSLGTPKGNWIEVFSKEKVSAKALEKKGLIILRGGDTDNCEAQVRPGGWAITLSPEGTSGPCPDNLSKAVQEYCDGEGSIDTVWSLMYEAIQSGRLEQDRFRVLMNEIEAASFMCGVNSTVGHQSNAYGISPKEFRRDDGVTMIWVEGETWAIRRSASCWFWDSTKDEWTFIGNCPDLIKSLSMPFQTAFRLLQKLPEDR